MANISNIRVSGVTYTIVDSTAIHSLDGYATSAETQSAITASTAALAQVIENEGYQNASEVNAAITAITNPISTELAGMFGAVEYDSTNKRINFKHTSTGNTIAYVDATDFIKDGMLSNAEIVEVDGVSYLRLTFNSDSGKNAIDVSLANIFNANNYYTKTAVDGLLADKQDTLVSATNIKTINGESILGSGDITINEGGTIDSALSDSSENAVQNKVVKAAIDAKNQVITLDSETLVIS